MSLQPAIDAERFVLTIEIGINAHVYQQIEDVAWSFGKPIAYAVNTSFHDDQAYGIHLLPQDVRIIQIVNTHPSGRAF